MDFNSTVKGSLLEGFYPEGWDFEKIDACCANAPEKISERQDFWNKGFNPVECGSLSEFDVKMGHEIANEIKKAGEEGMHPQGKRRGEAPSRRVRDAWSRVLPASR